MLSRRRCTSALDLPAGPPPGSALGRRLWALVAEARAAGLDPEAELRGAAREFRDAPYLDEFMPAARVRPGEWLVFMAWADKMDDLGSEFGPTLRAHLPG